MTSTSYSAVVYDLDGTLVRLDVDWTSVRTDLRVSLENVGADPATRSVWDLLELAERSGHRDLAEDVIGRHERAGARRSERLPLADELPLAVPVGVCSLNCEAACRIALEAHDLDAHVAAVGGRDSIDRYKPDPDALLHVIEQIGADPATTLFVGDSESDRTTAAAADVDFQWVEDRLENR